MVKLLTLVFLIGLTPVAANAQHEYSPLEEKTVNYKNWTLTGLTDEKPVDLRSLVAGKKLVMVVYFAPGAAIGVIRPQSRRSFTRNIRRRVLK